jgi:hypothetical protein
MEWQVMFAAGVATGLALWPLSRLVVWLAHWSRARNHLRFWRTFGFFPTSDPDLRPLLDAVVEQRLAYWHAHVVHARKELLVLRSDQPHSLIGVRRAMAELRRAKKRVVKLEARLADAEKLAAAYGFAAAGPGPAIAEPLPAEPPLPSPAVVAPGGPPGEDPAAAG